MNKPDEVKTIIFDCDGVLMDSEYYFIANVLKYLKSQGIEEKAEPIISRYIGIPLNKIVEDLLVTYRLPETYKEVYSWFEKEDNIFDHPERLVPMDGLIEFVKKASKKGIVLAVGSSSPSDYVNFVLKTFAIQQYFSLVLTISEVKRGKPAPDIYEAICEKLNVDKSKAIVIEDSKNGIKAAKAANIYTIGYKGSRITQDTSEADEIAYSYKEIEEKMI